MGFFPSWWKNKVKSSAIQKPIKKSRMFRNLQLERLEERLAPTATVTYTATAVTVKLGAATETATVSINSGGFYAVTDSAGINAASTGGATTGSGASAVYTSTFAASGVTAFTGPTSAAGTVTLTTALDTACATVTISDGTLTQSIANAIPAAAAVTIGSGTGNNALLNLNNHNLTVASLKYFAPGSGNFTATTLGTATLTLNGGLTLANEGTNGSPGNAYGVIITGTGALNLGGAVRTFTVAGQNNGGYDLYIAAPITNGGITFNGVPSTTQNNATGVELEAANSFSSLTINEGQVQTTVAGAMPASAVLTMSGTTNTNGANAVFDTDGISTTLAGINSGSSAVSADNTIEDSTTTAVTLTDGNTSGTYSYTGTISGAVSFTKSGASTQTLGGVNTNTGTTTVTAGTLINAGTLGAVTISGGLLTNSASGTIGAATVGGGTLANNGTAGAVTINSGTLGGSGTTGAVTDNATIDPGLGGSAILNTGALSFGSTGVYSLALNGVAPGSNYDQLDVSGGINLTGATLNATLGYTPSQGDTFTIIHNVSNTPITGTFTGLSQGSTVTIGGLAFTISYLGGSGGNDVTLTYGTAGLPAYSESLDNLGNLVITQNIQNPNAGDLLTFSLLTGTYTFSDALRNFDIPTGANASSISGGGTNTITIPSSAVNTITVTLGGGTNTFIISGTDVPAAPLTVNAGTTSGDLISITGTLLDSAAVALTASAISISGGTVTTTGNQTYTGAVTVAVADSLTSSANITFSSTVDGANALTTTSSGITAFGGAVGANTALTSLTTAASGTTTINGNITTTGAQSYSDPITLSAASTITSTSAGALTFGSTIDGAFALTIGTGGATTFSNLVGGTTPLASLTINTGGTTVLSAGAVTTSGAQTFGNATTLGTNMTLTGSNVTFSGVLNSTATTSSSLTVNATGATTFTGRIGGTTVLSALTVTTATLTAARITTGTGITITDSGAGTITGIIGGTGATFVKQGAGTLTLTGASTYTGGTTVSAGDLAVNGSITSPVTVNGGILGGTGTVGAVTDNATIAPGFGTGTSKLNTGALAFGSTGIYSPALNGTVAGTSYDQLSVTGGITLTGATLSPTLGYTPAVGDSYTLIHNVSNTTITGTFNGLPEGSAISINGLNFLITYLGGAGNDVVLVRTNSSTFSAYADAMDSLGNLTITPETLNANAQLTLSLANGIYTLTDAGNLNFDLPTGAGAANITGGGTSTITIPSSAVTTISVTLGTGTNVFTIGSSNAPIAPLTVNAGTTTGDQIIDAFPVQDSGALALTSAAIVINGATISTAGAQNYSGAATLGANTTLTGTGSGTLGNITFGSTIDGAFTLATSTAGTTAFNGAVGGATALSSLAVTGPASLGGNITTTGAQTYTGAVTVSASPTLTSTTSGNVGFGSTVNGAGNLAVTTTSGTVSFSGAVGGSTALTSLTVNSGTSNIALNGGGVSTTGAQAYTGPVTLGANSTFTASGTSNLTFNSTVDGAFSLTTSVGGVASFNGVVGGITPLTSVTAGSAGSTALDSASITTTGVQTYNNPVVLGANTTTNGSNVTFSSTVTSPGSTVQSYSVATTPYNWTDISTTGAAGPVGDDVSGSFTLPFTFNYFGTNVTSGFICTNGFVQLGSVTASTSYTAVSIPGTGTNSPQGLVGGWFVDLNTSNGGNIYYQTVGTAPNQEFIVEFDNVAYFSSAYGSPVTFEMDFFQGSNTIQFQYQSAMASTPAHTVGVQNAARTVAVAAPGENHTTTSIAAATGYVFTPLPPAYNDSLTVNATGATNFSGTVTAASLTVNTATLTAAAITTTNGVIVNDSGAASITGVIGGSTATLVKQGAGTLTLSANNTFGGGTTVSAGTLLDNGTIGAVTVNGGVLGGSGTAGAVTDNATISVGTSILSTGALSFGTNGGVYATSLNGTTAGTSYGQLAVTGGVTLTGATLQPTLGYTPVVGDTYTIISNVSNTPITGTFNGLAQGAVDVVSGKPFAISYTANAGNDVTLTSVNNVTTATALTASPTSTSPGTPVDLTAIVSIPGGVGAPAGTVNFYDGATLLNTSPVALNASGDATYVTSTLSPGTHTITADYLGDGTSDYSTSNSSSVSVTITGMTITTATLPNWTVGQPYNQTIAETGGVAPVTFAVTAGSLPTGLSLNASTGAITGSPTTTTGSPFSFTITATDSATPTPDVASQAYTVAINAAPTITTTTLPNATYSASYSQTLAETGGTGSITYTVSAGSLPTGLSLNASTGAITGTPTTVTGSPFSFTITATDSVGATGTQNLSITVNQATTSTTVGTSQTGPFSTTTLFTFTATVASTPVTTVGAGTVTFYAGPGLTNPIGSPVSVSGGSAVSTATTLPAGSDTVTAVYSGATNYSGSQGTTNVTVSATSTTTTLTDNGPNPSTSGQSVNFTGTVSSGVPTGDTVSLEDASNSNNVVATTTTGSGGSFAFNVSSLSVGTHNLFAVFAGDTTYATSQSSQVTQVVNSSAPAPTVTSIVVNADPGDNLAGTNSRVASLYVTFSAAVQLGSGAFTLALHSGVNVNGTTGQQVGTLPGMLNWSSPDNIHWTITFAGANVNVDADGHVTIMDGVYDLTVVANQVHPNGVPSVNMASNFTQTFWALFGDTGASDSITNGTIGDGHTTIGVGNGDFNAFANAYQATGYNVGNGYDPRLDVDGDGSIGNVDFNAFANNYQTIWTF